MRDKDMNDVVTVKGRKYIRLDKVTFAMVESEIESLMDDEKFVAKVKGAWYSQVCVNNGWGFTVHFEGYVVRFDLENSTGYKLPRIYEGCILEEPKTVQKTLLKVLC